MANLIVFLSICFIIYIFTYLAKEIDPTLNRLRLFFALLIIPLLTGISSISHESSKDCALIYDSDANTLEKMCASQGSSMTLNLLRFTTFLMYAELFFVILFVLQYLFGLLKKKGSYAK